MIVYFHAYVREVMMLHNLVSCPLVQAVAQAVGLRLFTAEAWFESQGSPYGNCGELSGTRSRLS
jgi:hypothetical protein